MRCSGDRGLNESDGLVLPLLEARQGMDLYLKGLNVNKVKQKFRR